MSLYIILLCIVCVFVLLSCWIKKINSKHEPPTFPGALPLLGHAYMMLGSCEHVWATLEKILIHSIKVGGVSKFIMGSTNYYVLSNPEDVSKTMKSCLDKPQIYLIMAKDWIGNGLVSSDVVQWKYNRKHLSPFFTKMAINRFMDMYNSQAQRLVDQLAAEVGKGQFDQRIYILNNVLETTNQTTLGITDENKYAIDRHYVYKVDDLMDMFIEKFQKIWLHIPFLYNISDLKKRQDKITNVTKTLCYEVIQYQKSELQSGGIKTQKNYIPKVKSVLDCLLEYMTDSEIYTDEYIRQHLETFIVASFDTTGTTLVYILKLIGIYSKVQDEMYKEIREIFGALDKDVNVEDLNKLVYLEAVIKETLRLYPVIPVVGRTASHDLKLKNYTIPRGETILCSIYGVHRHPAWGEDVDQFKPERWLGPNPPPANMFVGFSAGRRGCIGEQYAIMVMKIILVYILRRYIISSEDTELMIKYNILLKPVSGYNISIKLRS